MKTNSLRLIFLSALVLGVVAPSAHAQRQLGKKKGPTGKIYIAEANGDMEIQNADRIYTARQATAFDAPGTIIETKAGAHSTMVYSNGTGMFVDESTRVEVNRFTQGPFRPDRSTQLDSPHEPSVSQSNVFVAHGAVGICTSQLVSGSSMLYSTPQGSINIRGGKVSIESNPTESIIDLLEGDITVRQGDTDVGGQILHPGERATIRTSTVGGEPLITISPIPAAALQVSDDRTEVACTAKKSVTFEVIAVKAAEGLDKPAEETGPAGSEAAGTDNGGTADQEIVAQPTVPQNPPTNIVVSPDRLPGT